MAETQNFRQSRMQFIRNDSCNGKKYIPLLYRLPLQIDQLLLTASYEDSQIRKAPVMFRGKQLLAFRE